MFNVGTERRNVLYSLKKKITIIQKTRFKNKISNAILCRMNEKTD